MTSEEVPQDSKGSGSVSTGKAHHEASTEYHKQQAIQALETYIYNHDPRFDYYLGDLVKNAIHARHHNIEFRKRVIE